jgi:hypothetical protein
MLPNLPPAEMKPLVRAAMILAALRPERAAGRLGEADHVYLAEAEELLASRSGPVVTAAFLRWADQGCPRHDPRPAKSHDTGEKGQRPVYRRL